MTRAALLLAAAALLAAAEPGSARIAHWKDDRTAAFLLMFDDGWPSHWQVAVPELHKRGMIATFYVNPGKGEFAKFPKEWAAVVAQGQVLANHTMTHQGATTPEAGVKEIEDCQAALAKLMPGAEPRLISFGMPGVKEWKLPPEQHRATLARLNLVDRPPFNDHGAVYHLKTTAQMLALADKATAAKGMEYLVIHGVERITPNWGYQDFWALKQDVFLPLLDALKERSDRNELWITDHVTWHQYDRERTAATVKTVESTPQRIRLALTATTDPALYRTPLTVVVAVPAAWARVTVVQGARSATAEAKAGELRCDALPGGDEIVLTPSP